ncbi:MAG: VCBS repeat-containing protein, partial [Verrucomicrobiota bacterium]
MSASFFKTARTFVPRTAHSAYLLALVLGTSVSADENPPPFGIEFDSPDILEQQEGTAGSACGDLDKDGRIEFVTQEHFAIYDYDEGSINSYRPLPDINGRLDRFGGDIEIGDINGDTWPDIVLTDTSNSGDTGELIWFENPLGNLAGSWIEHSVSTWDGVGTGNQITHAE